MSVIQTIEQFLEAYKNGQRTFTDLEFEHGESFHAQDLSNITFNHCWFYADFTQANLTNTKFLDCNIKCSNFREANLTTATITGCPVDGTAFKNAIIKDFIFENNYCQGSVVGQKDFLEIFYIY
jgi:uncharacterized protein YjbI with pentapeptide repeats